MENVSCEMSGNKIPPVSPDHRAPPGNPKGDKRTDRKSTPQSSTGAAAKNPPPLCRLEPPRSQSVSQLTSLLTVLTTPVGRPNQTVRNQGHSLTWLRLLLAPRGLEASQPVSPPPVHQICVNSFTPNTKRANI